MEPDMLVSIVIPVKDGDEWLDETIPAMLNQKIDGAIECIVVDSGSTDNTLSILAKYSVKVIHIRSEEFNHGLTRNIGVNAAKGKFVVLTVQDAKPVSENWLSELLKGFTDEAVAGVCGAQIVPHHADKNPVEWYRPISVPQITRQQFADPSIFSTLSAESQLALCRWDNVNAIYRRDVLTKIPFRKTDFAEDALWARDALSAGYAIVYNPKSRVEHYHQEDYDYAYRRNFFVQYHFQKYFGVLPKRSPRFTGLLRSLKILLKQRGISFADRWKWLRYNFRNQLAHTRSDNMLLQTFYRKGQEGLDSLYNSVSHSVPQALKSVGDAKK